MAVRVYCCRMLACAAFGLLILACSTEDPKLSRVGLAAGCTLNSECNEPLVCAFSRCHTQCQTGRDCPDGQLCVPAGSKPFRVCRLENEAKCAFTRDCVGELVCGSDGQCRASCVVDGECVDGQRCVRGTCAEPSELTNGTLPGEPAEGQRCGLNSDCPEPLVCRGSICSRQCATDRDCAAGEACEQPAGRCARAAPPSGSAPDAQTVDATRDASEGDASVSDGAGDATRVDDASTDASQVGTDDAGKDDSSASDASDVDGNSDSGSSGAVDASPDVTTDAAGSDGSSGGALDAGPDGDAGAPDAGGGGIAASCGNRVLDGTETGVDCGGPSCLPCATGDLCLAGRDCITGVCATGLCQVPRCNDGVRNGSESDIDCGGATCTPCADGARCQIAGDCTSSACIGATCRTPNCSDGVSNGTETGIDCGGPTCPKCDNTEACVVNSDCVGNLCNRGICTLASCVDGTKNGAETGVDCGGPTCPDCIAGSPCATGSDCVSNRCVGGLCQSSSCVDGTKNGDETDVDCGGSCIQTCADGQSCRQANDCGSQLCQNDRCEPTVALTVGTAGSGIGTITSLPSGIQCGAICTARFPRGATVTLSISPANGNVFSRWSGDCSGGSFNCTLSMSSTRTVTANLTGGTGNTLWAYTPTGSVPPADIAFDAAGSYVLGVNRPVAGAFSTSSVDFGLGLLSSVHGDGALAMFRPNGVPIWQTVLSRVDASGVPKPFSTLEALEFDANGDVAFVVNVSDSSATMAPSFLDVGGHREPCRVGGAPSGRGIVIGKLRSADGTRIWSRCLGLSATTNNSNSGAVYGVAPMVGGDYVISGRNPNGQGEFGTGGEYFVTRVSGSDGAPRLWVDWGTNGNNRFVPTDVAPNPDGSFYVLGRLSGTPTVVAGTTLTPVGGNDVVVIRFASSGTAQWFTRFGGTGDEEPGSIAVDTNGDPVVAGSFSGFVNPGGGLPALTSLGNTDIFLLRLSASTGVPLMATSYGTAASEEVAFGVRGRKKLLVRVADGEFVLMGLYNGATTLGSTPLPAKSTEILLARFRSSDGGLLWVRNYGTTRSEDIRALKLSPSNDLVVAGSYDPAGPLTLDTFTLPGGTQYGTFFARFAP